MGPSGDDDNAVSRDAGARESGNVPAAERSSVRVVLAGGGTAGHIEPALNLADVLRAADPAVEVTAIGTSRGLETTLVPQRGYRLALIPPVPMPRRPSPALFPLPVRMTQAITAAARVLDEARADVLVGFGGYVALPAYFAARRRGVPIVVHEANAVPGLANRIGARLTRYVAVTLPHTKLPYAEHTGIPLRKAILDLDRDAMRKQARVSFGLDPDRTTLLVFGGSQGARAVNVAVEAAAPALAAADVQVLHVTGPKNTVAVNPRQGEPPYVTLGFVDRMDLAYAAADLAVCRAGMMTCAELAAVGLPAVYVPLPIGNGEQRRNAAPIVAAGGGVVVDDNDLDAEYLRTHVLPVLGDPEGLAEMSRAARSVGKRDAGTALRDLVLRAVRDNADVPASDEDERPA